MSQFPQKVSMPVAASNRSNNERGGFHITTSNFMDFNIARKFELAPKESVDINHLFFTRLDPLPVPTFGDAVVHNRVFFVPFRTIMPGYDDFDKDVVRAVYSAIEYSLLEIHKSGTRKTCIIVVFMKYGTLSI